MQFYPAFSYYSILRPALCSSPVCVGKGPSFAPEYKTQNVRPRPMARGVLYYVLYCTVLYSTVLHCTVLYYAVLYCTALYCTALYCAVQYCTVLCCTVLYCTVLYSTVLYCTVLHCTVLYCTALHCTVLYCTVLYCTVLHSTLLNCTVLYCSAPQCTVHGGFSQCLQEPDLLFPLIAFLAVLLSLSSFSSCCSSRMFYNFVQNPSPL